MEQTRSTSQMESANGFKIRTKLKFARSIKTGKIVGFVSQNPKSLTYRGVREDSEYPKKFVALSDSQAHSVILNTLYDCVLSPLPPRYTPEERILIANGASIPGYIPGYKVDSMEAVQFNATIKTKYIRGKVYLVDVSFGNKHIRFNPFDGTKETVKSMKACRAVLSKRCDIKNLSKVLEDFDSAATDMYLLMKEDMRELNDRRYAKAN